VSAACRHLGTGRRQVRAFASERKRILVRATESAGPLSWCHLASDPGLEAGEVNFVAQDWEALRCPAGFSVRAGRHGGVRWRGRVCQAPGGW
jgi:hypothetical protein